MEWYHYAAVILIFAQFAFVVQMHTNRRYALSKYKRRRAYRPRTVLIIPCKGLDSEFDKNVASFYAQDYEEYLLWFVVGEESDPAYGRLCALKEKLGASSKAKEVRIFVAGACKSCGQKIHNLLHCYKQVGDDVEVMAFADSDVCVRSDWLSHLVYPLRQAKVGAAGGYRWFVAKRNNPATVALSALNAKVAQLMGNMRFNHLWGGSMAIRVDTFRRIGAEEMWRKSVSDDLCLTYAVKKLGLKVRYVPACLVASCEETTWGELFEFGRRQFVITRVSSPGTWWFGLFGCMFSVVGLWGGAAMALWAARAGVPRPGLLYAVPIVFFAGQLLRAVMRQSTIRALLREDKQRLRAVLLADICLSWLLTLVMLGLILSSAFGRKIRWRGIRYKLVGPTETIRLTQP